MINTTQILLITVVTILTIILSVIGIHVVFILQELRRSIEKLNQILDDTSQVTGGVSKSFGSMSGLIAGLKAGMSLINVFKQDQEKDDVHDE